MDRKQAFEDRYGANARIVLSSIAKGASAGRSCDLTRIEAERVRHYRLMASLP